MNISKFLFCVVTTMWCGHLVNAAVSFSGFALNNAPGLSVGDVGVLIVDVSGAGFGTLSISSGDDIAESGSYEGFEILASNTAALSFGSITMSGTTPSAFNLGGAVNTGDQFGVLVFESSTGLAVLGDTYRIWTDTTWLIPADGSYTFTSGSVGPSNFITLSNAADFSGFVTSAVPEPASFALMFGGMAIGAAAVRRRRRV